ncbi:uncharacterized protein L201_000339 [Kwoniella dendrophila CBS 6074]|uniref:Up-regulated during septation protein 1 domain-containing protein n=1 Tax=Kwoniella dendrophila CBS 6074 TaxID=1295534 RepID=A0AAX4JLP3_9TREE
MSPASGRKRYHPSPPSRFRARPPYSYSNRPIDSWRSTPHDLPSSRRSPSPRRPGPQEVPTGPRKFRRCEDVPVNDIQFSRYRSPPLHNGSRNHIEKPGQDQEIVGARPQMEDFAPRKRRTVNAESFFDDDPVASSSNFTSSAVKLEVTVDRPSYDMAIDIGNFGTDTSCLDFARSYKPEATPKQEVEPHKNPSKQDLFDFRITQITNLLYSAGFSGNNFLKSYLIRGDKNALDGFEKEAIGLQQADLISKELISNLRGQVSAANTIMQDSRVNTRRLELMSSVSKEKYKKAEIVLEQRAEKIVLLNKNLKEAKAQHEKEIGNWKDQSHRLLKDKDFLSEEKAALLEEGNLMEIELVNLKKNQASHQNQLLLKDIVQRQLEDELYCVKTEKVALEALHQTLSEHSVSEIRKLKQQISQLQDESNKSRSDLFEQRLKAVTEERDDVRIKLDLAQASETQYMNDNRNLASKKIELESQLLQQVAQNQLTTATSQGKIAIATAESDNLKEAMRTLQSDLHDLEELNKAANDSLDSWMEKFHNSEIVKSVLTKQLANLEKALAMRGQVCDSCTKVEKDTQSHSHIDTLKENESSLKTKIRSLENANKDLRSKSNLKKKTSPSPVPENTLISSLKQRLSQANERITNLRLELASKEELIEKNKDLKKSLNSRIDSIEKMNKDKDRQINNGKQKIKELLEKLNLEKNTSKVNLEKKDDLIKSLTENMENFQKTLDDLQLMNQHSTTYTQGECKSKLVQLENHISRMINIRKHFYDDISARCKYLESRKSNIRELSFNEKNQIEQTLIELERFLNRLKDMEKEETEINGLMCTLKKEI